MPEIEARDSMTKEWVEKRKNAWDLGHQTGNSLVEDLVLAGGLPTDPNTRYLHYLYLLGVKQAIENHAREVGEVNFGSAQQEAQRAGRVNH